MISTLNNYCQNQDFIPSWIARLRVVELCSPHDFGSLRLTSKAWKEVVDSWYLTPERIIYRSPLSIRPAGLCLHTLTGHRTKVQSCAFSPDGTKIFSRSNDGAIKTWDVASGKCLKTLSERIDWVSSDAISPNGMYVVSGSNDNSLKIWDAASGKCLKALKGHGSLVSSYAFSPDGTLIISGSEDGTIIIWDTASGKCLKTLKGYGSLVSSCAFSPDGTQIVSGFSDETIIIWDTASGKGLQMLKGHNDLVSSCAFSPDGTLIVSGSEDGTIKIWILDKSWWLNRLWNRISRSRTNPLNLFTRMVQSRIDQDLSILSRNDIAYQTYCRGLHLQINALPLPLTPRKELRHTFHSFLSQTFHNIKASCNNS